MADRGSTRRLFIGLMPDAAVRAQIVAHRQQWFWPPGSRLIRPEQLHMTLHFLGGTDGQVEAALRAALAEVPVDPLQLVLSEPEAWRGELAVLRPAPHAGLHDLHARVAKHCGLRLERRPYAPHVTLSRDAPGAAPPEAMRPIPWTVAEIALIWSRTQPPIGYTVLGRYGGI